MVLFLLATHIVVVDTSYLYYIDNDFAFGANLPHERYIGKLAFFLLNLGVYPLYVAPRSPWNNGQVEGI